MSASSLSLSSHRLSRDKPCKNILTCSSGKSDLLPFQTGLCCVADLCKYQDSMDTNTDPLAGKMHPFYMSIDLCILTICLEDSFNATIQKKNTKYIIGRFKK